MMSRLLGRAVRVLVATAFIAAIAMHTTRAEEPASRFPTVPGEHERARALLENAMKYVATGNKMFDPASGYPFEGWNQDPPRGLFLRSFTQLTAIGLGMELLAEVAAGRADTAGLAREQAVADLSRLVKSLRRDQHDPTLAESGLLVNFLDLATGKRLGPLASDAEQARFVEAFGRAKGEAIWKALRAKDWIVPRPDGLAGDIRRADKYGSAYFDGPLAPFADRATREKVMAILDQRVIMLVFGDNANLSASAAKTIGALLRAEKDRPEFAEIRRELKAFLDDQRAGYAKLYDAKAGLFYFGRDATKDRLFGWTNLQGRWVTGHMDYFVNEFRGPTTFVAVRFGLPMEGIRNLGFKMKPYRMRDGRDLYAMAPWEGSAFQALGLGVWLGEADSPSWRTLLGNVVAIEADFAASRKLPGFLSESYTGHGVQYTGDVGIPEITVDPNPRITDAASLYALGAAYSVAPVEVERFLHANWRVIVTLLTDHGPWEGYNATKKEPIRFQTAAHTLALILGLLGTGSENMKRYLESEGLVGRLAATYATGAGADLLGGPTRVFAWADKGSVLKSGREGPAFRVSSDRVNEVGIAFVPDRPKGVDLSGARLVLRYRSSRPVGPSHIELKPPGFAHADADLIAREITTRLGDTSGREEEIEIPLPATPGLSEIKEVVFALRPESGGGPIDLAITGLRAVATSVSGDGRSER